MSCAGEPRSHEFCGCPQPRRIGLRHAADVAVLEGASTGPFHHFADRLLLGVATRRAAVRNSLRSWLNPELAADPLPLLLRRRRGGPVQRVVWQIRSRQPERCCSQGAKA